MLLVRRVEGNAVYSLSEGLQRTSRSRIPPRRSVAEATRHQCTPKDGSPPAHMFHSKERQHHFSLPLDSLEQYTLTTMS